MAVDRWAFLAPWCRILQDHDLILAQRRCGFREELRGLSVSIYSHSPPHPFLFESDPGQAPTQMPQVRDALELALLLAIVDRHAFQQFIRKCQRSIEDTAAILEAHPDAAMTHVELRVNVFKSSQAVLDAACAALSVFLTPQQMRHRDPAFQEARRQLLVHIPLNEVATRTMCENIKISVALETSQQTVESMQPLALLQVVENAETLTAAHQVAYPFVAGRFKLFFQRSTFGSEMTTKINARHAQGASSLFDCVTTSSTARWPRLHLGQALAAVFQTESSAGGARDTNGYSSVSVSICEQVDVAHFAQVCSALMHSRGVQSLSVSIELPASESAVSRRFHLRMVMFALFSRWANHRIQRVDFKDILVSEAEAEDINQLLLCENPIFYGGGFATYRTTPTKQVLVKKHATVRFSQKKNKTTGEPTSFTISEDTWFDVIGQESHDWSVYMPAYGKCRVRLGNVIQERDMRTVSTSGSRSIKSIRFDAPSHRVEDGRGMFSIVRRFGPQIEALTIRDASVDHIVALTTVLVGCPSLLRLHLPGASPQLLTHLLEAYQTGICTVTSLDLRYLVDDPALPRIMQLLCTTLANPTQRMTKTVQELLVSVRGFETSLRNEGMAILTMLENNTVLEYLERTCDTYDNEAFVTQCCKYNNTTIALTPVSPRCKAAFLSIVASDSPSLLTAAQLDSVMIRHIFDMAATRVVRKVLVRSRW